MLMFSFANTLPTQDLTESLFLMKQVLLKNQMIISTNILLQKTLQNFMMETRPWSKLERFRHHSTRLLTRKLQLGPSGPNWESEHSQHSLAQM